jgi:ParB-like chromosome segregation protein Spo0J
MTPMLDRTAALLRDVPRRRGNHSRSVIRAINDIRVGKRHRRDLGDIAGLAQEIAEFGLLQTVVVTSDNKLIAGAPRLEACKALGWPTDLRRFSHQDLLNLLNGGAIPCFEHLSKARSAK